MLLQTYSQFKLVGQHFFMSEWDNFHIVKSAPYKNAIKTYLNPRQGDGAWSNIYENIREMVGGEGFEPPTYWV